MQGIRSASSRNKAVRDIVVLHVISSLGIGGAEILLTRLVPRLQERGVSNIVLALGGDQTLRQQLDERYAKVIDIGMTPGRMPRLKELTRLWKALRHIRADLVHGWMYHGNVAAALASIVMPGKPPIVWAIHQTLYDISNEKLLTRVLIRISAFISRIPRATVYVSALSRRQHRCQGFDDQHAIEIPNGIDVREFGTRPSAKMEVRSLLGLPSDCLLVGHVARFHPMKDHPNLLAAAIRIRERIPNVYFVLIGQGVVWSNPDFAALAEAPTLRQCVIALGARSDIAQVLPGFDVVCLSSSWGEAFPLIVLEAMSSEVPCAVTDVGEAAVIVGDSGVVAAPRDSVSLADAIERLLVLTPTDRKARGERARSRIVSSYSIDNVVARYCEMYERVVGSIAKSRSTQ